MQFLRKHRALHIWIGITAGVMLLFLLLRDNRPLMTFWVDHISWPFIRFIQPITHLARFSLAEWYLLLSILIPIALLIREIRKMRRGLWRISHGIYRIIAGLLAILLTILASFSLLWGANYRADGFQERSGIFAQGATVADLERVTTHFAQGLNRTAHLVERDAEGVFAVSIDEIFSESVDVFRNVEAVFPFLTQRDFPPKPLLISPFMALTNYTGFYFPFTGEANINLLAPRANIPATVLHEFVHQRGIASENEANFVAILAGVYSENPTFAYSAYLLGYLYLSNALNRASPERFRAIQETLSPYVFADFADIRAHRERNNPTVARVMDTLNDAMLRSYGEESGIQSYGEVVDLLIVYF